MVIRLTNDMSHDMVLPGRCAQSGSTAIQLAHVERSPVSSSELGLTMLFAFIGPLLALYANGS